MSIHTCVLHHKYMAASGIAASETSQKSIATGPRAHPPCQNPIDHIFQSISKCIFTELFLKVSDMEAVVKQVHQYLLSWLFVIAFARQLDWSHQSHPSCKSPMITLHQSINIALEISADSVDK